MCILIKITNWDFRKLLLCFELILFIFLQNFKKSPSISFSDVNILTRSGTFWKAVLAGGGWHCSFGKPLGKWSLRKVTVNRSVNSLNDLKGYEFCTHVNSAGRVPGGPDMVWLVCFCLFACVFVRWFVHVVHESGYICTKTHTCPI